MVPKYWLVAAGLPCSAARNASTSSGNGPNVAAWQVLANSGAAASFRACS
jgi:hypothetical protein